MQVIKLGGSLCRPESWPQVLSWLPSALQETPSLIVPGGGRYSDCVREVQIDMKLDEATAHRQALLAMVQTAHLIQATVKDTLELEWPIVDAWSGTTAIWSPYTWLDDPELPMTWDLSSDSLALILATRLSADELILVKSIDAKTADTGLEDWVDRGWVDQLFVTYFEGFKGQVRLLGASDWGREPKLL